MKVGREGRSLEVVKLGGRQRVRSVLTAEGQQGSTDEGDQGNDCTEAGRSIFSGVVVVGNMEAGATCGQTPCSLSNMRTNEIRFTPTRLDS